MSSLIPFQFGSQEVRVVTINDEPLFSARDVALALGYENPSKAYQDHCKWLKKLSYNESLELGWANPNPQGEYVMPEGDVYRLAAKSKLESAQRFESWVYDEVLPSIRKTGRYEKSTKQPTLLEETVNAFGVLFKTISGVPGVKPGIAAAQYLTAVHEATGLPTDPFRLALPPQEEPATLNPTNLGKLCGMSAREVNLELAMRGLQMKNERGEWELTPKGQEYAEAYPYARNGHASYQILWKPKAQQLLN